MNSDDLCFLPARDIAARIRRREVSAREVMAAHLDRIDRLNPRLNAIVAKLDDARCLALAEKADRRAARNEAVGPLHGLPWAFKDLEEAIGFPCTSGSPVFKDYVPSSDTVMVERLRNAGVIPIGKTNVPEFGMGSHTYNKVYGATRNPYDPAKTAGGSSGGAAAAVAAGLLPLADGSDLGGSLRNPASFNNIVGLRPSVGLVPVAPNPLPFLGFGVKGPLARSASDIAFLMSVLAGADARDPGCYPSTPSGFLEPLDRSFKGARIAWCPDLGGLPLDDTVRAVLSLRRKTFESLGCLVEDAAPDFTDADEVFLTIRQWRSWVALGPLLDTSRDQLKPEAVWEIEAGARLDIRHVERAMLKHGQLLDRLRIFQGSYDFIVCAVSQVPPFDAAIDWPREIDAKPMENYIAWMKSAYWITTTLCPAISVPAGFTSSGLPAGIQIVGRRWDDFGVIQLAHAFEQATGFGHVRPRNSSMNTSSS